VNPVAKLEQQINITSNDTIINCTPKVGDTNNFEIRFDLRGAVSLARNPSRAGRMQKVLDEAVEIQNQIKSGYLSSPSTPRSSRFVRSSVVQLLPGSKFPQFRFGTRATTSGRATTESGSQQQPIIRIGYSLDHSIALIDLYHISIS
jgi:hypothetical protein